ncbi:hypothetical protein [Nannocystis punicea]|uniref:Uncharacterized protein n=1 Tax=Nannocystis punicea TaxID=2995304 RepID=A0ABY7H7D7_9BACT|nr:hypothetical protein [Nannocystis poenicansa]WAS95190.1 hypothetical protein O0S08_03430 [Nannocystis poenicansa]
MELAARQNGREITVRLDGGELRVVTRQYTGEVFSAGDRVRVSSAESVTRVTH